MANVNNYIAAGRASVQKALTARKALSDNKTDFGALGEEVIKAERDKKIAIIQANAKVANASTDAMTQVKGAEIIVDRNKSIAASKRSKRKAGLLAAGAQALGAASYLNNKKDKPNEQLSLIEQQLAKFNQRAEDARNQVNSIDGETYKAPTSLDNTGKPDSSKPDSGKPVSSNASSNTSGTVDTAEMYSYLTKDKGLSRNKALGLMANIQRESNFRPSIASGDDGGAGGLFQWKGSRQTETVRNLVQSGDWKGQIDYALSEPGEAYSSTFQTTTFNSPQQAADGWMTHWERPADTVAGSKKHTQFISGYNF